MTDLRRTASALAIALVTLGGADTSWAQDALAAARPEEAALKGTRMPTGMRITPEAMPGATFAQLNPNLDGLPDFTAGQAARVVLSPDGRTMLVLTSGYNRNYGADGKTIADLSNEYIFVYDVTGPLPVKRQVVQVPNTFLGIAWHPSGGRFFVGGGTDDAVHDFAETDGSYAETATIPLGHSAGIGIDVKPHVAGVAVSPDGSRLLVANYQNESVSLIDTGTGEVIAEQDLRPGLIDPAKSGTPGGTYPNLVTFLDDSKAYVTSQRDRELIALAVAADGLSVAGRQTVPGQPSDIVISPDGGRAYLALDNTDRVLAIDTEDHGILEEIAAAVPQEVWRNPSELHGANTNGLALSPDGTMLYATNGGLNAVSMIRLGQDALSEAVAERLRGEVADDDEEEEGEAAGLPEASRVVGMVPTGWYPTSVAARPDGLGLFVVNGKSNAGPNPLGCLGSTETGPDARNACRDADQYVWQLEKAGLLTLPMPSETQLADMTWQVAANNNFPSVAERSDAAEIMDAVRAKVDHVIYIVKENRTYDQILGDLEVGNGDPSLALLPEPISPNHHALARDFVTLDAFFDSGESSNTGWNWTTAARTTDFTERTSPVNYAGRGLQYDWEGANRRVNVGIPTLEGRLEANPATPADVDVMAGTADVAAPDDPGGDLVGTGYLWDAALRAGLTVRNYGFYGDGARYDPEHPDHIPPIREPFKEGVDVFFPTKQSLAPHSDPYFRTYDMSFPDYWLAKEWEREFDGYVEDGALPNLTLLRLPHDHFGNFDTAIDGVDTIETQMADNDYAIGRVVEKVAASPFADSTLIFIIEDDAQNGADHVDPHRSIALIAGPYVKRGAVVSEHYTTVSLLRTIEEVLGLPPLGINDGLAAPMTEVFDLDQASWSFQASVPEILRTTDLPLPARSTQESGTAAAGFVATVPQVLRETDLPLPEAGVQGSDDDDCFATPRRSAAYWQEAMAGQDFTAGEDRLDTDRFNDALWQGLRGDAPLPGRSGIDLSHDREELIAEFRLMHGCTE